MNRETYTESRRAVEDVENCLVSMVLNQGCWSGVRRLENHGKDVNIGLYWSSGRCVLMVGSLVKSKCPHHKQKIYKPSDINMRHIFPLAEYDQS